MIKAPFIPTATICHISYCMSSLWRELGVYIFNGDDD